MGGGGGGWGDLIEGVWGWASGQALVNQAPSGLGPSGFDP